MEQELPQEESHGYQADMPAPSDLRLISVVKINFSFINLNVQGLIQIFFNKNHFQTERINIIVNFDERFADVRPSLNWETFEEKIIGFICEKGVNFHLSNELKKKLDEKVNYKDFEDYHKFVQNEQIDDLYEFFKTFLNHHFNDNDFKLMLDLENITEEDFKNRAPDEDIALIGENDDQMLDAEAQIQLEGECVLAPVFGTPVYDLVVGDVIFVRVREVNADFFLTKSDKPVQQEAFIKSIFHDDMIGHTIIAELRPGVQVKIIETEDVKFKCIPKEEKSFFRKLFSSFFNVYILLFLLIFAIILFVIIRM